MRLNYDAVPRNAYIEPMPFGNRSTPDLFLHFYTKHERPRI